MQCIYTGYKDKTLNIIYLMLPVVELRNLRSSIIRFSFGNLFYVELSEFMNVTSLRDNVRERGREKIG